jgi:hypothetical protein
MDEEYISIDPDDPMMLRFFVKYLFNAWEQAVHNLDSARLALQSVPDWEKHYQEALVNPDRLQYTSEKFSEVQNLFEAILEGTATRSQVDKLVARLSTKPN